MKMNKKILLVEDNPDHASLITEVMLEKHDSNIEKEIILMEDGQKAIDFLKKADQNDDDMTMIQVGLVLLDLELPKVGGMEVLKFIKNSPEYRTVPVVILSATYDRNTIAEAYDNGADCYIVKPISHEVFANNLMAMEKMIGS